MRVRTRGTTVGLLAWRLLGWCPPLRWLVARGINRWLYAAWIDGERCG